MADITIMAKPIKMLEDSVFNNSVYHMQISLLHQKTVSMLTDFDRSSVYTKISYDFKPLRKTFTSISSEMTLP